MKIIQRVLIRILILSIILALIDVLIPEISYFSSLFGHAVLGIIMGVELKYGPFVKKSIALKALSIVFIVFVISGISYFLFQNLNWGAFSLGFLSGPFISKYISKTNSSKD